MDWNLVMREVERVWSPHNTEGIRDAVYAHARTIPTHVGRAVFSKTFEAVVQRPKSGSMAQLT